jgi:exosortase F-associated protein
MLKNKGKIVAVIILAMLLIAVRAFENVIFYDPFLAYFKNEFMQKPLPQIDKIKLFISLGFRYYINSMLSIAMLYVIFKDSKVSKFSIFLYSIFGILLLVSFFFVLQFFANEHKMILFYIRRFIIQPILLLLFIPAFYYQKKVK